MYINIDVLNISNGNTYIMDTEFGRMDIEKVHAGKLKLITGKIVTTDPILMYDDDYYSEKVKPGDYDVYIYVGKADKRKNQTVLSELRINENPVVKWTMALFDGETASNFSNDEFMGYETENGLGCFMDESVMQILDVMTDEELVIYEKKVRDEVSKGNNSCASIIVDKNSDANVIIFPSGWNNGVFPCYYGYDKNKKLAKLVTDFMVIEK